MDLFYKDYEHKSYKISANGGYLRFWEDLNLDKYKYYSNEISDFIVNEEDNDNYFDEANILTKINENKEGYFDFNKALIDIGSGDGNYAMLLDFDKNYCFEPNKRMCCLINTNMYLKNKVYNTIVYNVALGDKDGDTAIFNGFAEI